MTGKIETATLAGGCFWCLQSAYDGAAGVIETTAGYTGGTLMDPSYEEVSSGTTGHLEAVRIEFDPSKISFNGILDIFWQNIDPTQADGQFADRGPQYKTAIFFHTDEQKKAAEESKKTMESSGKYTKPIATQIRPAVEFYPAEDYHQHYPEKNRVHYEAYKEGSGRGPYLRRMWGEHES